MGQNSVYFQLTISKFQDHWTCCEGQFLNPSSSLIFLKALLQLAVIIGSFSTAFKDTKVGKGFKN